MKRNTKLISCILLAMLMLAVLVAGCTTSSPVVSPTPIPVTKTDLTVFAAASLSSAFNDTKTQYEAIHPETNIIYNFDGTQNLRTEVEQGAYADVFAAASTSHMNALKNESFMNNTTIVNFANNKLAVIVPKNNPANINSLSDLAKPGIKLVICDKTVPCGSYTLQLLDKMANNSTYGPDYKAKAMANVVSNETNVNFAVSKVALGEADAAFVYVSDVPEDYKDKVAVIKIPDSLNVVAVYPIGELDQSKHSEMALSFIDFVKSDQGKAILTKYRFAAV